MLINNFLTLGNQQLLGHWWGVLLLPLVIWTIIWKGLALWKAARRGENVWFILILIINTMGILEILYYFLFSNDKKAASKKKK